MVKSVYKQLMTIFVKHLAFYTRVIFFSLRGMGVGDGRCGGQEGEG